MNEFIGDQKAEDKVEGLNQVEAAIIAEETALHERVKHAVRDSALEAMPDMDDIKRRLVELRDEAIHASERDLPALFQALYTQHSLASRSFKKVLPDMRSPYFGRMRLMENGKQRDILIGYQSFIDSKSGVTIIDWRQAQIAKVFFNHREGDEYELELPERIAHGVVTLRRLLTFEVGELTGVISGDLMLSRERGGSWHSIHQQSVPHLAGGAGKAVNVNQFGMAMARQRLPDVSALLDRNQYEILNKQDSGALLILGGAGCGKTTIALHRLALLSFRRPKFYTQKSMTVVVPEHGLVRLTQRLLRGLNMDAVGVSTFDSWVTDQGQKILKGLPKKLCGWTSSKVTQIKRDRAMNAVLDAYIEQQAKWYAAKMRAEVPRAEELALSLENDTDVPLAKRFMDAEAKFFAEETKAEKAEKLRLTEAGKAPQGAKDKSWRHSSGEKFFAAAAKRLINVDGVRSELFTNPSLHAVLLAESKGIITESMIKELARHAKRQFEEPDGGADYKEHGARATAIDEGELEEDDYAGTIDVEDYAILLNYMLKLTGKVQRKGISITNYSHMVIDEAQDLAPLELRLLGKTLYDNSTVTVAGDAAQQSDPTISFAGWDSVLHELGVDDADEARLTTNYRCPRPVAEFGHMVLGALAPAELPASVRDGLEVVRSHFANEGLAAVAMTEALRLLFEREPQASVAIICATEENARRIHAGLQNLDHVRLVIDGEFEFKPGIDVTEVAQIKGLEFDYVIIPDVTERDYPDTPVARRSLHIAVTRTVHQLWVLAVGRPSAILPVTPEQEKVPVP